jgi:hypothetical protein
MKRFFMEVQDDVPPEQSKWFTDPSEKSIIIYV